MTSATEGVIGEPAVAFTGGATVVEHVVIGPTVELVTGPFTAAAITAVVITIEPTSKPFAAGESVVKPSAIAVVGLASSATIATEDYHSFKGRARLLVELEFL